MVVDRLVAKGGDAGSKRRLTDSVETALNLAGGVLLIEFVDVDGSKDDADPSLPKSRSRRRWPAQRPPDRHRRDRGTVVLVQRALRRVPALHRHRHQARGRPRLLVPDDDLSLADGAIAPWSQGSGSADYFLRVIAALGDDLRFSMDTPWKALPERAKEALLYGENYKVHVKYRNRYGRDRSYTTGFEGVVPFVKRRHAETDSDWSRSATRVTCGRCPAPSARAPA